VKLVTYFKHFYVKRIQSHVGQRELHNMIYATVIKAVGTTNHPKTIHV